MIDIPWPESDDRGIVFIVDAGHAVEESLLSECISELQNNSSYKGSVDLCVISIARQPEEIDATSLLELSDRKDDALLIPIRIVWMPALKDKKTPTRVRDLLRREQMFPSAAQATAIIDNDPKRVLKIAGVPATVAELHDSYAQRGGDLEDAAELAQYIAGQAGLALDIEERRHRGGRYKVPRRVGENIKASKLFVDGLAGISEESGRDTADLLEETDVILKELIATPQPFWLDMAGVIAKKMTSLAYESEIVVAPESLERVRNIVASHPTAFLWTHKTHVDGMAMQQVLFENDLPSAHTFGGLNMAFAGLAYTSRKSGVIFIRRTFQDNPLYKLILRLYIGYLLEKRFPFSWAFEGTRSRVGKLMPPRYGLLKYLLEAAHTTGTKNLHLLPVAINYDMIGDVSDYAREEAGETKRPENLSWFVGYLRGLRQPMGRIYMDFGEAVVLETAPDPEDKLAIPKIAFQVAVEANRVTPITLASLAAMVLLTAAPRALTSDELSAEIELLVEWARQRKIPMSSDFEMSNTQHADSIVEVLVKNKLLSLYHEGSVRLYQIPADQHGVASYYRNTTVHHFIVKAFAEVALLYVSTTEGVALTLFWQEIERLKNIFKFEFFYQSAEEFKHQVTSELSRFDEDWERKLESSPAYADELLKSFRPLVAYTTLIQFAGAIWIVASVMSQLGEEETLEKAECVSRSLSIGRQAYLQQRISSKSSIGKQLFTNSFGLVSNMGLNDTATPKLAKKRQQFQQDLRKLINRLERIRARSLPY